MTAERSGHPRSRRRIGLGTSLICASVVVAATAACTASTGSSSTTRTAPLAAAERTGTATQAPGAASAPAAAAPTSGSLVATATVPSVSAYRTPGGAASSIWTNPAHHGVPLTFRVVADRGAWLKVQLPRRPNGSTGWIRASDVALTRVTYRLVVSTGSNTLTLFDGATRVRTFDVATGTGGTPTPHGSFYLTELLSPTNAGYGPYAFGLSAFSEALTSFGGGPGQIGLHGTDDAASIGHAASHGCIRMSNHDIASLARLLPLGTPITIR